MVVICDKPYCNTEYNSYFENYPYTLSDFQKYSIESIVKGQHVLVTAHTGSGKTLPAEFALNHFFEKGKKVIYTSPIKALSNQKFYEFTQKYPHIQFGLMTGDIKTNPNADVLIMTTEILMNYLYSYGSNSNSNSNSSQLSFQIDIEKELACVVFDEVHYINDADRGQTWEQTILMLPPHIQMVMLSATIDNPQGFAQWVENIHKQKSVYLASTNHRVVPLTHYAFFTTTETPFKEIKDKEIQKQIRENTNKLVLLRNAEGGFNEPGYHSIKQMVNLFDKHRFFMKRKFVLNKLAQHLKETEMLPALVFVFSRKNVEVCAHEITTNLLEDDSKVPYIMRRECEQIVRKFPNYKEYLELPEFNDLVGLLEKGIGIHHSGMIPVLREIVEIMISKKYIKLLFATESFAIGLDCPIKTAVFSSLTKFDGSNMRLLLPHEYTQMAGRAGRRGLDTIGHVVHCNNLFDLPLIHEYREVLCGKPQKLISKFKMHYSIVLGLLKNGQTSDFHLFAEKSMLKKEMDNQQQACQNSLTSLESQLEKKKESLALLKTPQDVCKTYLDLVHTKNSGMCSQKKRKEIDNQLNSLKDFHKWIIQDCEKWKEYQTLMQTMEKEKGDQSYFGDYMKIQMDKLVAILVKHEIVIASASALASATVSASALASATVSASAIVYQLPLKGIISSNINEIHPLIACSMFIKWKWFADFSVKQLIILFSLFTNVNVPEEFKKLTPAMKGNEFMKYRVLEIQEIANLFEKEERDAELYTGICYEELLSYDLMEEIGQWCDCETEEQCKYILQMVVGKRNISVGDFTKAVLKISVISKEFIGVCEIIGHDEALGLLHKLKDIDGLILKYIATSQSLYV